MHERIINKQIDRQIDKTCMDSALKPFHFIYFLFFGVFSSYKETHYLQ